MEVLQHSSQTLHCLPPDALRVPLHTFTVREGPGGGGEGLIEQLFVTQRSHKMPLGM
jgi:hypothetical protein